jgi:ABC-type glycerol-3-phosphate transport system substrate-binding protein
MRYYREVSSAARAAALVAAFAVCSCAAGSVQSDSGLDASFSSPGSAYAQYRGRYAAVPLGEKDVPVDVFAYSAGDGVSEAGSIAGEGRALRVEEDGYIEYTFFLEQPGLYNLRLEYYPVESRGISLEWSLSINGEVPFAGADQLVFPRVWGDGGEVRKDKRGNEIRPPQVEKPRWETAYCRDSRGYNAEPYLFSFPAGQNTLRLSGTSEPLVLRSLVLAAPRGMIPYARYIAGVDPGAYQNRDKTFIAKFQGEEAKYRSDPSLYAQYDRSSGATEPASASRITLNMTGGDRWRTAGQWIEWEIEAPEDGMYRLSIKARQNYNRGFVSSRSVMIDGEIPCVEMAAVPFRYDNKWGIYTLKDAEGKDLFLPLTEGKHLVRLQVALGELGPILEDIQESVFRLNGMYRKILALTGAEPDIYRDYRVEVVFPEVVRAMGEESAVLYRLADRLTAYAGERSPQAAAALTLARQLAAFEDRPEKIPPGLSNFKSNTGSLGSGIITLSESRLDIDYLVLSAAEAKLPAAGDTFLRRAAHEMLSFLASFFTDYNSIGDSSGSGAVVLWLASGRDQSSILKTIIDDSFTPQTGIPVSVRLVGSDAIMPAVVAGTGPDVALTMGTGDPVNYAMRKAVADLSVFPDFEAVIGQFHPSALTPFRYAGGVYALPETQRFHVMFYRKDIMDELGLEPPETWTDFIKLLPVLQKNSMNAAVPTLAAPAAGGVDIAGFLAQLYQRSGALYNAEGSRTALDSPGAAAAFDAYTKFFTHYGTPASYDFVNRFRTGENPLAFAEFTNFNTLEVSAPEIRGLWSFGLLPGIRRADGTLDRSMSAVSTGAVMFAGAKNPDAAWEFLRWWVSAETQARYGRELESIMGAAARYDTANLAAFEKIGWKAGDLAVLREQRNWAVGTPEVPGGYYANRYITNAARRVVNDGAEPRETLLEYNRAINEELSKKRKEFGLE